MKILFFLISICESQFNESLIVLNQANFSNPAYAINLGLPGFGNVEELTRFNYKQQHQVYKGCSAVYNGRMLLFGGDDVNPTIQFENPKSIGEVIGCELKTLSSKLPHDMIGHSCSSLDAGVLMCGSVVEPQLCFMFQGTDNINSVQNTNQQHNYAAMVTFQSFGIIIAGDDADFSGKTVEAYDGSAWNTVGEFPIVVDNHSAVVIGGDSGAVYVFGGWGATNAIDNTFLTLDGGSSWIKGPTLLSKRAQHRSVLVDGYVILHLGGRNATDVGMDVEMWTFQDAAGISRTQLDWHLPNFTLYPEPFLIDYKDAQKCK